MLKTKGDILLTVLEGFFKSTVFLRRMDNYLFLPKRKEYEELSADLGFTKTFFPPGDFVFLEESSKNKLLEKLRKIHKKIIVYRPATDDLLRFALEKTTVDIFLGVEHLHPKDSVHYLRSGLDQILCTIAAERGKTIAFSFSELLNSPERAKLLARMMFNIKLCQKYKIKMLFSTFTQNKEEMRSAKDLEIFWQTLQSV